MCGVTRMNRVRNEEVIERIGVSEKLSERVRRACAEREIGLEEARGLCSDRDAWRSMTDRIV